MTGKKYTTTIAFIGIFILFIIVPFIGHTQITISEIQYNPAGSDGGYEWIELANTSNTPVSIEDFTFRESDKNHRLVQTNETLGWHIPPSGFAIVADNPTKFLEKHPGFPGLLFDSSFTLINTGELLEILNTDSELVFGFEYNPVWGGDGDGSTLGFINTTWVASIPTPGSTNTPFIPKQESTTTQTGVTPVPKPVSKEEKGEPFFEPVSDIPSALITLADPEYKQETIKADAGPDRTVLAGVPFIFTGSGFGIAGGALEKPQYFWNFGDGIRAEGKQVIHAYSGPGTYTGTLRVTTGRLSHTDHFIVTVIPPELRLSLSEDNQYLSLTNTSPHTIELTGFIIESNAERFRFPEGSFISGQSQIILAATSLALSFSKSEPINLLATNKHLITTHHGVLNEIKEQIQIRREHNISKETRTEEKPEEVTEPETLEQQVVYIAVPHYIENTESNIEQNNPAVKNIEETNGNNHTVVTSSLPQVSKRPLLSTFEILLLILFSIVLVACGMFEYQKYKKQRENMESIEIEEV